MNAGPVGGSGVGAARALAGVGVVVIGRNEGATLGRTLAAALAVTPDVVYVDSASDDDSVAVASGLGVHVVHVDPARPMNAARARNEGYCELLRRVPGLRVVQFLDGDSEPVAGWIARGIEELDREPQVWIVCGRIVERHPDASPYNRMCALEWDQPPGDVRAVGGNMLVRAEAFEVVGGFRSDVVAAEDDEFCLRIRAAGGTIRRLDVDMVLHDADLTTFAQWWTRAARAGRAYAQGYDLHGRGPEQHFRREVASLAVWGAAVPAAALVGAPLTRGLSLGLFAAYPLLGRRIYQGGLRRGWAAPHARLYARYTLLAKVAGAWGAGRYAAQRLVGRPDPLRRNDSPTLIDSLPRNDAPQPRPDATASRAALIDHVTKGTTS